MEMSQEHKDALAQGRKESREIKAYLKVIESRKRGRPITRDSLQKGLARVNEKIEVADDPLRSVELIQTRLDIEDSLEGLKEDIDIAALEAGFVAHARSYSERKGITYTAWREYGVPAATLRDAGIPETRRR